MSQEELKQKVLNLLDEQKVGTLATVEQDKPHTRYMTFFHEGLTLYTPTSKETHKADEIEKIRMSIFSLVIQVKDSVTHMQKSKALPH